jgi:CubicO group peptidase (beta-lactamase class C family)
MKPLNALGFVIITVAGVASCTPPATESLAADRCFADSFRSRAEIALTGYADVGDVPGVSVGVVLRDSLVYIGNIGFASRKEQRLATADTPYNIASLTKVVTATLAIQMAEEGLIDLDAPISDYLPDSVHVAAGPGGIAITTRHLLGHTAGLAKNPPNRRDQKITGLIDPGVWEAYNLPDLYAALAQTELDIVPGQKVSYSNYGYAILGHLLERAAEMPFEALLKARITTPLGMTNSAITLTASQQGQLAAFHWDDDPDRVERSERARYGNVAAFIGMTSTVRDMAKFLSAYLSGDGVVSEAISARMQEHVMEVGLEPLLRFDRTLGWYTMSGLDGSDLVLMHTGNVDGHTASLFVSPGKQLGVVMLQNLGGTLAEEGVDRMGEWFLRAAGEEVARCSDA